VTLGSAPKKIRTLISFDDGAEWSLVQAPTTRADGIPLNCQIQLGCSLHLVGSVGRSGLVTTDSGPFFSAKGAVGLAMGVGNVGMQLLPYDQGNTYLTNDGGLTWQEVRVGPHRFEFGDRGALVVIINDNDPTDHIRYSWDEGRTWDSFRFSNTNKLSVTDLVSYEDSTTERFLVVGTFLGSTAESTIMIDFSDLHQAACTSSDFEMWSPSGSLGGSTCLLGSQVSYQRRKSTSQCSISTPFTVPVTTTAHCLCTGDDFECDVEYFRDESNTCVHINGDVPQPSNCLVGSTFSVPSGYRRIPKDVCSGGLDLTLPVTRVCQAPTTQPPTSPPPTSPPPTNPPTNPPPTATPSSTTTPVPTEDDAGHDTTLPKQQLSGGAWAAIILVPVLVILLFAGALFYRKYYGDFRLPKIFQRVRYSPVTQDEDDGMLLDDY